MQNKQKSKNELNPAQLAGRWSSIEHDNFQKLSSALNNYRRHAADRCRPITHNNWLTTGDCRFARLEYCSARRKPYARHGCLFSLISTLKRAIDYSLLSGRPAGRRESFAFYSIRLIDANAINSLLTSRPAFPDSLADRTELTATSQFNYCITARRNCKVVFETFSVASKALQLMAKRFVSSSELIILVTCSSWRITTAQASKLAALQRSPSAQAVCGQRRKSANFVGK